MIFFLGEKQKTGSNIVCPSFRTTSLLSLYYTEFTKQSAMKFATLTV